MSLYLISGKRRRSMINRLNTLKERKKRYWLEYKVNTEVGEILSNDKVSPALLVAEMDYNAISVEIESIEKQLKITV